MMRLLKNVVLLFIAAVMIAGAGLFYFPFSSPDVPSTVTSQKIFIPRGTSLVGLANILAREQLVRDAHVFRIFAELRGMARDVRAGEFEIPLRLSLWKLVDVLKKAKPVMYRVTVPEGQNYRDVARILMEKGLVPNPQAFTDYVTQLTTLGKFGLGSSKAVSLEGYLFPDSYDFTKLDDVPTIVQTMVGNFRRRFLPEWEERARLLGLTPHEVVILASVVEKETGAPEERPLIAAVFHNRLKIGMKLQSDPTTIYGIANFDGNLTRKHLEAWGPYNTYRIKGLPLGPICNPGTEALRATLYPAESPYIYFVSKNDGSHHFSSSLAEHQRAVIFYQKMHKSGPLPRKLTKG